MRKARPLTAEEIAEFKTEGWGELLVTIGDETFNREDCHTCEMCRRSVVEVDEDGDCDACARPSGWATDIKIREGRD